MFLMKINYNVCVVYIYIVCPPIYEFLLPLWYLQTLLVFKRYSCGVELAFKIITFHFDCLKVFTEKFY